MQNIVTLFKNNKLKSIVLIILGIFTVGSTGYILYALSLLKGIETLIRVLFSITLVLIGIILCLSYIKSFRKKRSRYGIYIPFVSVYCAILIVFGYYICKTYSAIDKLTTSDTTYSSSLVSLSSNEASDISSIGDGKIGMVDDDTNVIGYQIPSEIIEEENLKNKVVEYESYIDILNALYDEEIEYAFLPTNYAVMFETMEEVDFKTIRDDTKIIYTKDRKVKSEDVSSGTSLDKPFTILLMGVDSETEAIAGSSFNGDSLILLTFNPNTLSSTILSIPRDSYVPITCFAGQRKNKITHAAWYGEECMMDTIENFTGIPIDYFVKINFKGVVKLVDTLGGVDVDVPYSFCEQDSNRKFGNNTIYVNQGFQTLNGEQALAFARNRHPWPEYCPAEYSNYVSNDFIRGQNQQTVIRALLNKLKGISSLDTVYSLLDTIGESMQTNMTTSEILSLYNIAKDILVKSNGQEMDELLSIQRLYLSGYDKYIYDSATKLNLYNYVLYDGSVQDVSNAMKVNLEMIEPTLVKTFSFSIDEPYEETVVGQGVYSASSTDVEGELPDFTGDSEEQARKTANRIGISVSFIYTEVKDGDNTVISQSYPEGTSLSKISKVTLTIGKPMEETNEEEITDDEDDDSSTSKQVKVPYFTDLTVSEAIQKCKSLGVTLEVRNTNYKNSDIIISQEEVGMVDVGSIIHVRVKEKETSAETPTETPKEEPTEEETTDDSNSGSSEGESTNQNTSSNDTSTGGSLEVDDKIEEE